MRLLAPLLVATLLVGTAVATGRETSDVEVTQNYEAEISAMREIARGVDGTDPDATITIVRVTELPDGCPSFSGCAYSDGTIWILDGGREARITRTVLHEIAHAFTITEPGHGPVFCELIERAQILSPAPTSSPECQEH